MTKQKILEFLKDLNFVYNNCNMLDSLETMLDELISEHGWHKTSEELPKLSGELDTVVVQCFKSPDKTMIEKGIDSKVYICHYCRRKIRGKTVDRFESKQYTLVGEDPEYWKYLSDPPEVK